MHGNTEIKLNGAALNFLNSWVAIDFLAYTLVQQHMKLRCKSRKECDQFPIQEKKIAISDLSRFSEMSYSLQQVPCLLTKTTGTEPVLIYKRNEFPKNGQSFSLYKRSFIFY